MKLSKDKIQEMHEIVQREGLDSLELAEDGKGRVRVFRTETVEKRYPVKLKKRAPQSTPDA